METPLPAASRESMVSRVKQILLDRILSGAIPPGTRLRELHLAAELHTSQGPIREALRELEASGLVESEPYKGSRVREISAEELREAYVVRAALEELAGTLAAPQLKGATARQTKQAAAILKAARQNDRAAYASLDVAFHRGIVAATGNSALLRSWDALGFEIRVQIRLTKSKLELVRAQKAHWDIIDALDKGESRRAGKLMREHVAAFISPA